jgi:YD repeat-containing protein
VRSRATSQNLQSVTSPSGTVNVVTNADGTVGSMSIPLVSSQLTYSYTYTGGVLTGMTTSPPSGSFTSTVDAVGRVLNTTDTLGNVTRYEYDRLNNPLSVTDPAKGMSTFTYDGNGNLLTVTDAQHLSAPTIYTYDSMDRLTIRTDPLHLQNVAESYTYYANGNLHTFTDRKGQTTTLSYDSLNRLMQAQFQDNSTIGYVYDSSGRIQYINDSVSGQISRTYDNLDLLLSEQTPLGTVSYVNDALGRRSSMTTPGQTVLTYGYDSGDHLNQITQGATPQVAITYDTAGRRSTLTLPNGIVATYGYDTSSRLTSISYDNGTTHVGDLSYGYDTLGRRTSMGVT